MYNTCLINRFYHSSVFIWCNFIIDVCFWRWRCPMLLFCKPIEQAKFVLSVNIWRMHIIYWFADWVCLWLFIIILLSILSQKKTMKKKLLKLRLFPNCNVLLNYHFWVNKIHQNYQYNILYHQSREIHKSEIHDY